MKKIKALAFDIDGTILESGKTLFDYPQFLNDLSELLAKGIYITAITNNTYIRQSVRLVTPLRKALQKIGKENCMNFFSLYVSAGRCKIGFDEKSHAYFDEKYNKIGCVFSLQDVEDVRSVLKEIFFMKIFPEVYWASLETFRSKNIYLELRGIEEKNEIFQINLRPLDRDLNLRQKIKEKIETKIKDKPLYFNLHAEYSMDISLSRKERAIRDFICQNNLLAQDVIYFGNEFHFSEDFEGNDRSVLEVENVVCKDVNTMGGVKGMHKLIMSWS